MAEHDMAESGKISLEELNVLGQDGFVCRVGPVFEHSPWIAEAAWSKRPFADSESLRHALCETVDHAADAKKLALIRAHPDLAGRAALTRTLTRESAHEQTAAGLNRLSPEEIIFFKERNAAYQEKFGFPFVICARLNKKEAMLQGLELRLKNSREVEVETALAEIFKIAELRLHDLIGNR